MWLFIPSQPSASFPASDLSTSELNSRFDISAELLSRSATWRTKSRPPSFWRVALRKTPWLQLLSGLTLEPLTAQALVAKWISSTVDFPCPDISCAGKRAGLDGARSGLWVQFARIIRQARPRFVFIENVRGMLNPIRDDDGRVVAEPPLRTVLRDLFDMGFDAEWGVVSAEACGLPQGRDRVFILAHAYSEQRDLLKRTHGAESNRSRGELGVAEHAERWPVDQPQGYRPERTDGERETPSSARNGSEVLEFANSARRTATESGSDFDQRREPEPRGEPLGDTDQPGLQGRIERECGLRDEWVTRAAGYPLFPRGPGLGGGGVVDRLRELFERKPETAWR